METPRTLLEAVKYFDSNENCVEFVKSAVWPDGKATCPRCECQDCILLVNQQRWMCRECRKQFSIKLGTIFEKSPLPLSKWLVAMWLICNSKNGISSHELARAIGVTQKSTWFMLHRLREAMRTGTFKKLGGHVEVDETFVGGRSINKHAWKRTGVTGGADKTVVFGAVERGGEVTARVITSQKVAAMKEEVRKTVEAGANLYTDELTAYKYLKGEYAQEHVSHGKGEYSRKVDGKHVHTNTIEGFWSLLKRCIKGTWTHVEAFHLDRYLDEQCFRYNLRKGDDLSRFEIALTRVAGRRLTWNELTGSLER